MQIFFCNLNCCNFWTNVRFVSPLRFRIYKNTDLICFMTEYLSSNCLGVTDNYSRRDTHTRPRGRVSENFPPQSRNINVKNLAYGRHWIFLRLQIVAPIIIVSSFSRRKEKNCHLSCVMSCVIFHLSPVTNTEATAAATEPPPAAPSPSLYTVGQFTQTESVVL